MGTGTDSFERMIKESTHDLVKSLALGAEAEKHDGEIALSWDTVAGAKSYARILIGRYFYP